MVTKSRFLLEQFLNSNQQMPLLIVSTIKFEPYNFIALPADIDERELHVKSEWQTLLSQKAENAKVYLVIENLDEVSTAKQEQFIGLIKDKRAGGYKLPANAQIIMPVKNSNAISEKIKKLSLVWSAE